MTARPKPPSGQEGFFWKTKTLEEMSSVEWESLCDGCARCCLEKLEDEDTGEIYWTSVGCRLFDAQSCRCSDYANRLARVSDCVGLTPRNVRTISWLPSTCAYRLVAEGRDLYWWHRLVSGSAETVHEAGISMRGRVKAVNSLFIGTSNQLGEFESGTLAGFVGPVWAVALGGLGTIGIVLLWTRLFPALPKVQTFHEN